MYKPIPVDRENLTIMGVRFPDLDTLNSAACAIGSNMYEGFEPTESSIALIRDYITNKITFVQFVKTAKSKVYAE
jgi:putative transcriptional regulator